MATSTLIKGFYEPADAETPYGDSWRSGFSGLVDAAFAFKTIGLTGDKVLTSTANVDNESRSLGLRFTGTGAFAVTPPNTTAFWIVRNDCTGPITFGNISITSGSMGIVAYNGSAFIELYRERGGFVSTEDANTWYARQTFNVAPVQTVAALTSGTTITLDLSATGLSGRNTLTLGHNATLANPPAVADAVGMSGWIAGAQDGTGGRTLAFGSIWFRRGDSVTLPSTANAKFHIEYSVISATRIDYAVKTVT